MGPIKITALVIVFQRESESIWKREIQLKIQPCGSMLLSQEQTSDQRSITFKGKQPRDNQWYSLVALCALRLLEGDSTVTYEEIPRLPGWKEIRPIGDALRRGTIQEYIKKFNKAVYRKKFQEECLPEDIPILDTDKGKGYRLCNIEPETVQIINKDSLLLWLGQAPKPAHGTSKLEQSIASPHEKHIDHGSPHLNSFSPTNPPRLKISKLPHLGTHFYGREAELDFLNQSWDEGRLNVIAIASMVGSGKTALIERWRQRLASEGYRGANCVIVRSFDRQCSEGESTSSEMLLQSLLRWFEVSDPERGSPWEQGVRLAEHIQAQRTLLIIDALEMLQYGPGPREGQLRDDGIFGMLNTLVDFNPGLCVVTSRLPIVDLDGMPKERVCTCRLGPLPTPAGVELLNAWGVRGDIGELGMAVEEVHGHCLTITILGSYLREVYQGDVLRRNEAVLSEDQLHGHQIDTLLNAYEHWFEGTPELAVLFLLALFEGPADLYALAALRSTQVIEGLTDIIFEVSNARWQQAVATLRRVGLIAEIDSSEPESLDTHRFVREYFNRRLKAKNLLAWEAGHSRLFEYFQQVAPELPFTLEDIEPLYRAVTHGCKAQRHHEAFYDVYQKRIDRGCFWSVDQLGGIGVDLEALASFFEQRWHKLSTNLTSSEQACILDLVSYRLQLLLRLQESVIPRTEVFRDYIRMENWQKATLSAGHLCEIYKATGRLCQALKYTEQAITLADKSNECGIKVSSRLRRAHILQCMGHTKKAHQLFDEAMLLYSNDHANMVVTGFVGFYYFDHLANHGNYEDTLRYAEQLLEFSVGVSHRIIDIGLGYLAMGRAYLLRASQGDYLSECQNYLDRAVHFWKCSGSEDEMPRPLLLRAELYLLLTNYASCQADLHAAHSIIIRGNLRLFEVDYYIISARLCFSIGNFNEAQDDLRRARKLIAETGYRQREAAVTELELTITEV